MPGSDWACIIPWSFHRDIPKSPFAAYLIPQGLKVGEHVLLEDLIEDLVGGSWNQGDAWRLQSCEAVWNGADFEHQFDPKRDISSIMG